MKRSVLILFIAVLCNYKSYAAPKQDSLKTDSTKKGIGLVVKADILLPIFSIMGIGEENYSFTIEKLLLRRHSLQLTYYRDWYYTSIATVYDKGLLSSFIPEYKFFVSKKKAHAGYYVGAYARYDYQYRNLINYPQNNVIPLAIYQYKESLIGIGISNGVQFYLFKKITIDVLLGCSIRESIYLNTIQTLNINPLGSSAEQLHKSSLDGRVAINIGYKF